ncbi:MAG: hypothetical protein H6619_03895 [Deltaproteobacteria bacterium]|nr:hypothetical protein [Deltaproteobacteria bacterium]
MINSITSRLVLVASILFFAVWLYLTFSPISPASLLFTDDGPLSFAIGRLTLQGQIPLLGQPSHFGGRHLGPWYYYLCAVFELISGKDPFVTALLFSALKAITVLSLIWFTANLFPRHKYIYYLAAAVLLFCGSLTFVISVPWVNHFLIVPSSLTLICTYLCLKNGPSYLPFFLAAASLQVQTFFGSAPMAAVCALTICAHLYLNFETFEPKKNLTSLLGTALFLLSWVPVLLYEVQFDSNLAKLFARHFEGHQFTAPISDAFRLVSEFLLFYMSGQPIGEHFSIALISIAAAILSLILIKTFYESETPLQYFLIACIVSIAFQGISLVNVEPPLHHFYLNCLIPVVIILSTIVYGSLLSALLAPKKLTLWWITPAVATGLIALVLSPNIHRFKLQYDSVPFSELESLKHAKEVSSLIDKDNNYNSNFKLILKGEYQSRKAAIYLLAKEIEYARMPYAPYFKELPAFKRKKKKRRSKIDSAYLLVCGKNVARKEIAAIKDVSQYWTFERAVDLTSCSTCQKCALNRFSSKS